MGDDTGGDGGGIGGGGEDFPGSGSPSPYYVPPPASQSTSGGYGGVQLGGVGDFNYITNPSGGDNPGLPGDPGGGGGAHGGLDALAGGAASAGVGGSAPINFGVSAPSAALTSFAPGGGISLPTAFPDLTSSASGSGEASGLPDTFNAALPPNSPPSLGGGDNGALPPNATFTSGGAAPPFPPESSNAFTDESGFTGLGIGGPATDPYATPVSGANAPITPVSQNTSVGQAPGTTAPSGPSGPSGGSALDKIASGAMSSISKNPLGILAAGAGLGLNMFRGNKDPEGLAQIRDAAASLQSTGSVLQHYLTTGTLPPGMQASVDAATKAAKARIIGNYASRGVSTNPLQNSALQQELAQVDQNAIITAATIGDKLMSQGLTASQISQSLYNTILKTDMDRTKATGAAIANFAAALGGGGSPNSGINLKIG